MLRKSLISSRAKNYMNTTSMSFNGTTEYVLTGYKPSVDTGASLCTWVKMRDFTGEQTMGCGSNKRFFLGFNGTNIAFGVQNQSKSSTDVSSYVKLNQWHHLVLTADGGTAKVYIDGILRDTMSYTESSSSNPADGFVIGARNSSDSSDERNQSPMNCLINEVAIYCKDLTSSEVKSVYNNGSFHWHGGADLCAWWRMGDGKDNSYLIDDGGYLIQDTAAPVWDLDASGASGAGVHSWEKQHVNNTLENNSNIYRTGYASGGSAKGAKITLSNAKDLSSDLNLNHTYRIKMQTKRTGVIGGDSTSKIAVTSGHASNPLTTYNVDGVISTTGSFAEKNVYFIAEGTSSAVLTFDSIKVSESVDYDNITIHQLKGYQGLTVNIDNGNFIKDSP